MNLFDHTRVAEGYARDRPDYTPVVMDHLRAAMTLTESLGFAVDVGCGTGISTRALASLAAEVLGTEALADVEAWITQQLAPWYPALGTFVFGGDILYLKRESDGT